MKNIEDKYMPTVDVVITTYNRPLKYLKRAIVSVLKQSYPKITIAVVNDYPEDKELASQIQALIRTYNKHPIYYFSYEKNMGACYARNYGAKKLEGEYIAFLDDDDEWEEDKIALQIKGFNHPNVGFVYSPIYRYGIGKDRTVVSGGTHSGVVTKDLLKRNIIGGCSAVTISRNYFEQVGGFDERLKACQDYDLWMRLSLCSNAICINVPLTNYYLGDDSISWNYQKLKQGHDLLLAKYRYLYENHPEIYSLRLRTLYYLSMSFRQWQDAKEYWKKANHVSPQCFSDCIIFFKGLLKYIIGEKYLIRRFEKRMNKI